MLEEVSILMDDVLDDGRNISYIEMGCDNIGLSCTTGKIKVWFGKHASVQSVRKVLECFSRVDSSFVHETEIICDYDQIPLYENNDYTLISYGRFKDGYKVIFNIHFSKQHALNYFIESIINELKEGEVNKTVHWNGSMAIIMLIFNELKSIEGWNITKKEYREEE
jgi:hypothetical protein